MCLIIQFWKKKESTWIISKSMVYYFYNHDNVKQKSFFDIWTSRSIQVIFYRSNYAQFHAVIGTIISIIRNYLLPYLI